MCFSATASFAVASVTAVAGVTAVMIAPDRRYVLFASIPLGFAFQQTIEGMIWRRLDAGVPGQSLEVLSNAFLLIGEATWPLIIPIAVWLIEPNTVRKAWLGILSILGALLFGLFTLIILSADYNVFVDQYSLHYDGAARIPDFLSFYPFSTGEAWHLAGLDWTVIPYSVATVGALLLSSHRLISIFGGLAALGLVASLLMHRHALVSIWCFFAAVASLIVLVQVRSFAREFQISTR